MLTRPLPKTFDRVSDRIDPQRDRPLYIKLPINRPCGQYVNVGAFGQEGLPKDSLEGSTTTDPPDTKQRQRSNAAEPTSATTAQGLREVKRPPGVEASPGEPRRIQNSRKGPGEPKRTTSPGEPC